MKKPFLLLTALALPFASALTTTAAVNPAVVSGDARWLVYADVNALRQGTIGKELILLGQKMQAETPAGSVGLDWQKLLETIGSVTAYGANLSPDPAQLDGALVLEGKPELRKIAESLLLQANLANPKAVIEITDLPFPAYAMREQPRRPLTKKSSDSNEPVEPKETKAPKTTEPMEVIFAFPPEPIILVSKSKAQILKARDVFKGATPSLAKTPSSPLAKFVKGSEGAYLFSASTVPPGIVMNENAPQARILKMTNAGSIALGERGENIFAHSELVAASDQMAEKLMKILQGLTAMLSLAETTDKALSDFINSANVERNGNTVSLDLSYSATRLAAMVKSLQQPSGPVDRSPSMIVGRSLAEWQAEAVPGTPAGVTPGAVTLRTISDVTLKNGSLLTLARKGFGPRNIRYDRVEIAPADGTGAAMIFKPEIMRANGPRGMLQQFSFPGADGTYTLKVYFQNDPDGKAGYAVSVRDPRQADLQGLPPPQN